MFYRNMSTHVVHMRMHNAAIQKRSTEGNYFWEDAVLCRSISLISFVVLQYLLYFTVCTILGRISKLELEILLHNTQTIELHMPTPLS